MPRALGQIDLRKYDAILEAATEVLAERGLGAPLEEIARRARVSKQTVYNQFGSKTELVRTLVERRRSAITAPLEEPGAGDRPDETLTRYARSILDVLTTPAAVQLTRMGIEAAVELPELSRAIYNSGRRASRDRLITFLTAQAKAGVLDIDDPKEAAEFFIGMVTGGIQMRLLMGLEPEVERSDFDQRARDCAERFIRAYAPV